MSNRLDVIIFAASGYTGKSVVQIFVEITKKENLQLTWGVAGRSLNKLQQVLKDVGIITGEDLQKVPIVLADTTDENSLLKMTSQSRVIINCAGPYRYHGEPMVRACIQHGCHYVDITAEPQFQERIQLLYNKKAALKNVHVVPACGIASLIPEMGVDFLQKNFDGTINSIESYWEVEPDKGNLRSSGIINNGTWQSLLWVLHDYKELKEIRTKLFKKMPDLEPKLALRRLPHKAPESNFIAGPFPGPDATVMRRSQRYFYEKYHSRPVQIHTYVSTPDYLFGLYVYLTFWFFAFLVQFRLFYRLFSKYPKLFTGGIFADEPNDESKNILLTTTLYGRGWKGKIVDESYKEREDAQITVRITGRDAYRMTAVCAIAAALILLDTNQKLPELGGVYTPASCFKDTNLVDLLQNNGIQFEICGKRD